MPRTASYANIASTLALVLALSGTAYAAVTVTGKDVKDGSLSGRDVKNRSLAGPDLRARSLTGLVVKDGSLRTGDLRPGVFPGASALRTTGGEVPAGPSSAFTFNADGHDTRSMFAAPGRFITVRERGTYLVTGAISFGTVAGTDVQTRIVVDGAIEAVAAVDDAPAEITLPVTATMVLAAGDRVTLGTFIGGESATIVDFASAPGARLSVQMVSP